MRKSIAVGWALAFLPLAALAGCSAAAAQVSPTTRAPHTARAAQATHTTRRSPGTAIATDRWSALASSPLGARSGPLLAWAGGRLLEVGGYPKPGTGNSAGAAFDPATGRWRRIAPAPGDFTEESSFVAAGRYLAVADGTGRHCPAAPAPRHCWTGAALYNLAANRWTVLALPRQFAGLSLSAVTWTGRSLVFGAVSDSWETHPSEGRIAVAAYAPATGRWQLITPALPRGHTPGALNLLSAGGRLLVWAFWQNPTAPNHGTVGAWGTDVFTVRAGSALTSWRNVSARWPLEAQYVLSAAGDGILAEPLAYWCGTLCSPPEIGGDGYLANPATLALKRIPADPFYQFSPGSVDWVWDGDAIIAVNAEGPDGSPAHPDLPGDMALYNPAAHRWAGLPGAPGHPRDFATPVWSGSELLTLTSAGRLLAFHH